MEGQSSQKLENPFFTKDVELLADVANKFRIDVVQMTNAANSGHATTGASMAELMTVIFCHPSGMQYDPANPRDFNKDKFVLSKGHASPALYVAWCYAGFVHHKELLTLRSIGSELEGHPCPRADFVDVATGSLGMGLSMACGMAYSSKFFDKIDNRYWVMMGDAELNEGSIWEGVNFASYYKLDNIIAFLDVNGLGQSGSTMHKQNLEVYEKRFQAFGWETFCCDGHNVDDIVKAVEAAKKVTGKPQIIIAKTEKGRGLGSTVEGVFSWHGKPIGKLAEEALPRLRDTIKNKWVIEAYPPQVEKKVSPRPGPDYRDNVTNAVHKERPNYKKGALVANRQAYGTALKKILTHDVNRYCAVLDADVRGSTFAQTALEVKDAQFIETFISEELMVSLEVGLYARGKVPFASTFATFFERATDQIRMSGITHANIKMCGSHCGISIGKDGPSHMAVEDIAVMRCFPDSVVLFPSDAVSVEYAVEAVTNYKGICYIRTAREATPILYDNEEEFHIGKCKVWADHADSEICLVSGGVCFPEALQAAKALEEELKIKVSTIDIFSVKPIDREKLLEVGTRSKNRILTIEDNYPYGNLFSAVCEALATTDVKVYQMCVNSIPKSGEARELMEMFGLTASHIKTRVQEIIQGKQTR